MMTTIDDTTTLTDGDRLIQVRAKYNLKQASIASLASVGQSAISMIEKGDRPMKVSIARAIHTLTGGRVKVLIWKYDSKINKQHRRLDS